MLKIKLLQVNHNDRDDRKQPEFPDFSPCLAVKKVTIDAINYKDDGEHCTLDQSKLTVAVLDNDRNCAWTFLDLWRLVFEMSSVSTVWMWRQWDLPEVNSSMELNCQIRKKKLLMKSVIL